MADDLFDRILDFAAAFARRKPGVEWPAIVARAFRRDVTCYDWRINSLLDDLGVTHRSYPSKSRIPGRVAFVHDVKDAPADTVLVDFLSRGGTLVVEGTEQLDRLGLRHLTERLEPGHIAASGELVRALGIAPSFWADDDATTIALRDGTVLVDSEAGPLVSSIEHEGGTVVAFATGPYSYERKSDADTAVSPRQLATELGIAIADSADALVDDAQLPRDLLLAEISMASVLGHVVATGLG